MVLGIVGSDCESPPPSLFIGQGLQMNSEAYQGLLKAHLFPWIKKAYGDDITYIFQQDSAPAHKAKTTVSLLNDELGKDNFWPPNFWLPNSPDLNLLNYYMYVWSAVEKKSNNVSHNSLDSIKKAIKKAWDEMDDEKLVYAASKFRAP